MTEKNDIVIPKRSFYNRGIKSGRFSSKKSRLFNKKSQGGYRHDQ